MPTLHPMSRSYKRDANSEHNENSTHNEYDLISVMPTLHPMSMILLVWCQHCTQWVSYQCDANITPNEYDHISVMPTLHSISHSYVYVY